MQAKFDTDIARWQAVTTRDKTADGAFFYAVKSTGVFCRPGCPSRLPKIDNAEFYDSAALAEGAGYRACKRCRPKENTPSTEAVQKMRAYIEQHLDERITLETLAVQVALSPFHLQRLFKQATGLTPRKYQEAERVKRFKNSLKEGNSVTHATYDAGFASSSRLYEAAKHHLGMRPKAYREKGLGVKIAFGFIESRLGTILIAATGQGLCSVALGDDAAQLEADLRTEFSCAEIEKNDDGLRLYTERIAAYLSGSGSSLDLTLDIQASAFRRRVWDLLRAIPYGETRSYSDIAQQLGNPNAVRAVASACANNPVALVIPCHRVVQKSGALAGYRWGLERKAALLAGEREEQ